jgi:anti-repressor protein
MNQLIKIGSDKISGDSIQTVNARDLHAFLEIGKDFSNWIKGRIEHYGFVEGTDYVLANTGGNHQGGRPAIEYHISLDMGKELAMVERNGKGKEARQYFIECEKRSKQSAVPQTFAEALRLAADQAEQIALMAPKADFFDTVTGSTTAVSMSIVAKTLNMGIGRNRIFEILRSKGILDKNNIPYQRYCGEKGYFRVIESPFEKKDGTVSISFTTVVYQKGLDFIRKQLNKKESRYED